MKKARQLHLWIGLICSIFIFVESITGLLLNEPWLIGQTQMEGGRGNFQPGQFNPQNQQGTTSNSGQAAGPTQGQNGQFNGQSQDGNTNGQFNGQGFRQKGNFQNGGQNGMTADGQFANRGQFNGSGQMSFMSIVRGLHEGSIGNLNIKWLIDLTAVAMIFLTGTGIYLSTKILAAGRKRKNNQSVI